LVFTNSHSDRVNVLYRRRDGHYGLIQPIPWYRLIRCQRASGFLRSAGLKKTQWYGINENFGCIAQRSGDSRFSF
jgi:hypothetical protein